MAIKLKDVARQSGYSITTVSRALAGYSDVNEQTRRHIIEVASSLGYQPNLPARQLRIRRTNSLGLVIPARDHSYSNEFFSQLLMGIGDAAAQSGYDLLISAQAPGEAEMACYRRMVGGNLVDGVILVRTRRHDERIAYLSQQQIPFMVFGRAAPGEPCNFSFIDIDSQAAIRALVDHFTGLGHRRIGLILPPEEMAFTPYRLAGYQEGLENAGLPYDPARVVTGDLLRSGGEQGARILLDRDPKITAIIACNDLMALGAMRAIESLNLQVGRDIAVAGYDDIPAAEYAYPSLTTIHQPIYEIGQRLVTLLLDQIEGRNSAHSAVFLPYTLVVRASSGAPRQEGGAQPESS
ncbi:MAG: LacI family DNA-binding transcriptional regulator [Chloroflexota bacterium]|nr:MAG: LacI family transcriptional regulator [Chloroflexota bacterium]